MYIRSILQPFGILNGRFVAIWYMFPRFGMLYQDKSGKPGPANNAPILGLIEQLVLTVNNHFGEKEKRWSIGT
jgi:hypothetical protein